MADAALEHRSAAPAPRRMRRRGRSGLLPMLSLVLLATIGAIGVLSLTGKPVGLPVWAVAEVETRLNRALAGAVPEGALSVGAIEVAIDADWVPRLRLEDVRLLQPDGGTLVALPDLRVAFDSAALLRGEVRARSLRIIGARLAMRRMADGSFDLAFGTATAIPPVDSFADLLAAVDGLFALPALNSLRRIEGEALTLSLQDDRIGRTWEVGDGRLTLENRDAEIAMELALSLVGGGSAPARAVVTAVSAKQSGSARISAMIDGVAAADIAAQAVPLAWLGVLDAPISGRIAATINTGGIAALEGELTLGAGALRPDEATAPIRFDRAGLRIGFAPEAGRLSFSDLVVESRTLRLRASGHGYLLGADGKIVTGVLGGRVPPAFLAQIAIEGATVDPEGLFERPVVFTNGAIDLRLALNPFSLTIGQVALVEEGGRRLSARGQLDADPGGWRLALDVGLDGIAHDRLLALWPVTLVPGTRKWVGNNVARGTLSDVKAALRLDPGAEPRLALTYDFVDAEVRFLRTLPPIRSASGYSTVEGQAYTMVLSKGTITPPEGGAIDMTGSVFSVPDMAARPTIGDMRLKTESSLTAALSLLDQPPFNFMTKAGMPVAIGEGRAVLSTALRLPLVQKVQLKDVTYKVEGRLLDVSSSTLVKGKAVTAPDLFLSADPAGLQISGAGLLGAVPFDVTYRQGFGAAAAGRSQIEGAVTLSPAAVEEFGLGLPQGMVSGSAQGQVAIDLVRGAPGQLRLTSDLAGLGLTIPELGWTKPRAARGQLTASVTLGTTPSVDRIALEGAGLRAEGRITLRREGGLELARFDRLRVDRWLDAGVDLTGRGAGRAPAVTLTSGSVDLRGMPDTGGTAGRGGDSGPLNLRLDRLTVSDGIALTGLRGTFSQRGGLNGSFTGSVNGQAEVRGTVAPAPNGTAIRLQSGNAGAALAAAGVFRSARGGTLDLQLTPRGPKGHYDGVAEIARIGVRDASVLAELLSAVSVVGLLEQLNGQGIAFSNAQADFLLTPEAIEVRQASAIGASLGVSMAGVYQTGTQRLNLQGVISPIYLLNGIGAMFTRRGEGLFGFNYSLRGTADAPEVSVNPLSILTPGLFREIFRSPPPVIGRPGG